MASFYASKFQWHRTASGEFYNEFLMTAACNKYPLGTYLNVTNLSNGKQIIVKINDRIGAHRLIDLSLAAANKLGMKDKGITKVKISVCQKNT